MPQDFGGVMHEFKHGELHSGSSSGPKVKSRKQAEAIAYSEQSKMGKKDPLHKAMGKVGGKGY